ncbi:MAG: sensor domain-containing phosphodiesterase [Paenisporosarcina sp.]
MQRSITVLHINAGTYEMTNLMNNGKISTFINEEIEKIILQKIHTSDFENFNLLMGDQTYEIRVGKDPSNDYMCLITPRLQRSLEHSIELEMKLRDQQAKLFELAKSRKISKETLVDSMQSVCETISDLIDCERIGIWLFDEEHRMLTVQNVYDLRFNTHTNNAEFLDMHEFPTYFQAVKGARALAVNDVSVDHRVSELYPTYFESVGGIKSMLDAPIILSSGIGGVLSCESLTKRVWTELDETLVGTLADLVAFLFERVLRIEAENQVRDLAYIDQLTGLSNQNAFITKANEELKQDEEMIFAYLQLDQFSNIQDVLGFESGEVVLKQTANRLTTIFPEPAHVARIGFDHFAVCFNEKWVPNYEIQLHELKKPMNIDNQEVYMTYSYGVSHYPSHGSTAKECLQRAQIALNDGRKYFSRGVTAAFIPDMIEVSKSDLQVEMNLRKGLDFEEFTLFYQPQMNCQTNQVEGFEALIRWNHPERGLVTPIEFISLAESTGLILPIGEWVIRQAFKQLQNWKEQGRGHFTISVNISPRHFLHERLASFLETCLIEYEIHPEKLMIEITENVAMEDYVSVQSRIKELRQLGFSVSIDDFGTGFSAFVYLQHFPIQEIKIDRHFIREIIENPKSFAIVKTIVELAKDLELRVITEGIETEEQLEMVRAIGCDIIQGYYYSKPLPIHEMEEWLAQRV